VFGYIRIVVAVHARLCRSIIARDTGDTTPADAKATLA